MACLPFIVIILKNFTISAGHLVSEIKRKKW